MLTSIYTSNDIAGKCSHWLPWASPRKTGLQWHCFSSYNTINQRGTLETNQRELYWVTNGSRAHHWPKAESQTPRPAPSHLRCPFLSHRMPSLSPFCQHWMLEKSHWNKICMSPAIRICDPWGLLKSLPCASKTEQIFLMIINNMLRFIRVRVSSWFKTIF